MLSAIRQGRRSKTRPRWLTLEDLPRRGGTGRPGTQRFVWTQDERRAYVIERGRSDPDKKGDLWRVMTTLVRLPTTEERLGGVEVKRTFVQVIRGERRGSRSS